MKKLITLFILICIFGLSLIYHDKIVNYLVDVIENIDHSIKSNTPLKENNYASKRDYNFVKKVDTFSPTSEKDIRNIYYTIIQSGMDNFTFYCSKKYDNCIHDVDYISNNQKLLSYINDFVPVYNSFKNIETEFDSLGKVNVGIKHTYTNVEIKEIEEKVDAIIKELITDDMDNEAKIKVIHDYIINNTKYDVARSDNKVTNYHSDTAYGALLEGYAICGGYADSMKIFLDRFDIPNFKVSSENHIWNAVYLNNKWYHLDLTWDDPVTKNDTDILEYNYFLIDTDELLNLEPDQHMFDEEVFLEFKVS